jgi:methionine-rich copper-binding protein CopC
VLMRPTRRATVRRTHAMLLACAATLAIDAALALPAHAHATLVSSSPEDGARIDTLPASISFTFDENVASPAFVAVTSPDGSSIVDGDPAVLDATVTQQIKPVDERGRYTMSFRVTSVDGHPVTGTIEFTVTVGRTVAQVEPADGAAGSDDDGSAFEAHSIEAVVAVVVVLVGVALLIGSGATARGRAKRG